MSDCPLVRLAKNLKLLKRFEQTGRVAIPIADWLCFFEAPTFLTRSGGQREIIYCAIGARYLLLSKMPIEWKAKKGPSQNELFE